MTLRRALPALPGLLALLLAWASYGGRMVDDAFISLSYANQLAQGHGLVFHPLLPPTEGYSNLLWTLLLSLAMAVGLPGPTVAAASGMIFAGLTQGMISVRVGGWRGALLGIPIAFSPIFGFWAGQGLEGSLFLFLLCLGLLNLGQPLSYLSFALLGITRVEGIFYGFIPLSFWLFRRWRGEKTEGVGGLLWLLVPTLLQFLFRFFYYGALLPATVLAKVQPDSGALQFGIRWLSRIWFLEPVTALLAILIFVLLPVQFYRRKEVDKQTVAAVFCSLGILCFSVAVGGDWMPNLRWLQPAIPLLWLAAARLIEHGGAFAVLAIVATLSGGRMGVQEGDGPARPRGWNSALDTMMGGPEPVGMHPLHLFVLENLGPDAVVLAPDVGQLAWLTGNPVLDPQGLNWRSVAEAIAHQRQRDPVFFAKIAEIQETVRELAPVIITIPIDQMRHQPRGPVGEALLGSAQVRAPDWFASGWKLWHESPQGDTVVRYYRRIEMPVPLTDDQKLERYDQALLRMPKAETLKQRKVETLRRMGRGEEASRIWLDGRFRQKLEIWPL